MYLQSLRWEEGFRVAGRALQPAGSHFNQAAARVVNEDREARWANVQGQHAEPRPAMCVCAKKLGYVEPRPASAGLHRDMILTSTPGVVVLRLEVNGLAAFSWVLICTSHCLGDVFRDYGWLLFAVAAWQTLAQP